MATANELLRDQAVSHLVNLQHHSNGVVYRIIAVLNRVDARLFAALTLALDQMPASQFNADRLEQLLFSVRALNRQAYEDVGRELTPELRALVDYEAGYQLRLFEGVIPPQVRVALKIAEVNVEQAYSAALARPFQGVLLRQALDGLEAGRQKLIRQTLAHGYVENKTVAQMVQEMRGTRANQYNDGIFARSRADTESVVRTATSHFAGVTRDRFMLANNDLIAAQSWTSTLDGRTSEPCILRDGKRYTNDINPKPVGHSLPWGAGPGRFHWNCRSCSTPITKSFRDLGLNIDEFSPGTRASMDGQVPAETTYADWLKRQSAARQDEVLGATRGKLLRDGGFTVDRFANDKGRWLTLDELKARDASAFKRAGL